MTLTYSKKKKLSALSREITSKYCGDFYRLNCLHSFRIKKHFHHIKKYVKKKIHDDNKTLSEGNKILDVNQYQKSYKAPFIIYADS